jgi:tetratricopeptide (TPR) repeat protein
MNRLADLCSADDRLADLVEDLTGRLHAGEALDPDTVAAGHPDLGAELRRLLPALAALAGAADASSPPLPLWERGPGGEGESAPSPPSPTRGEGGESGGRLGDFRLIREIGRGGMGVVYEAEQLSLNRRVALKVLPFAAALNPRQLQRFKTEAQAAAQLHHTHIVPVYAVGCEQGVHYYAMQLIDGQTLADAIAQMRHCAGWESDDHAPAWRARLLSCRGRRGAAGASPSRVAVPSMSDSTVLQVGDPDDPAASHSSVATTAATLAARTTVRPPADTAYFRHVATLIAQAAEALDYAHQLGVVHRDVKPANLMADPRGHLWVTDFGLARLHADEGEGVTVTGELLGTLRYMSPEQATARRGVVDHRTDIYALGMSLYELLTLEPAFTARNRAELFAQIAGDDPAPPRRRNRAVPAELGTITLKALAKDLAQRYGTAQELADDLRRFLDDRPVLARRPTAAERLRRWARRHWLLVRAAAAAAAFAVGCLAVSVVLIGRQRDLAVNRGEQARRAVDEFYTQVAEHWLGRLPHLETQQREFLQKALRSYQEFAHEEGRNPAVRLKAVQAQRRVADIRQRLGEFDKAETSYDRAVARGRQLANDQPGLAGARAEWAVALNHRGHLLRALGRPQKALEDYQAATKLFTRLADEDPADASHREGLAGSHVNLGLTLHGLGHTAEAEAEYAVALKQFEQLVADHPDAHFRHGLALCANDYGRLLDDLGRPEAAGRAFTRAVGLWKKLAVEEPAEQSYRQAEAAGLHNLARLAAAAGRYADAERSYQQALALRERLAADFPQVAAYRQELAATRHGRGVALAAAGRHGEAERSLREAFALRHALAAAHPGNAAHQRELADTHHAFGDLLCATGRWAAAEQAYRAALAVRQKLSEDSPTPPLSYELAVTRHALGRVRMVCGPAAEAEPLLRAAATGLEEHVATGPAWALALAAVEVDLGRLLAASGRPAEAEPFGRRAAGRAEQAAAALPGAPAPRELVAGAWALVGTLCANRPDEAAVAFRRALAARRQLADVGPARPRDRVELAWLLATCPDARFRDPAGAVAEAKGAVAQAPHDGTAWNRLGVALCRSGDWAAAAEALEKAVKLHQGGDRTDWLFLALAYRRLGEDERAKRWADRLAEADRRESSPPDAEWVRLRAEAEEW